MPNPPYSDSKQHDDARWLSEPRVALRLPVSVIAYRLPDDHELIRAAWVRLHAEFDRRSHRQFIGAFDDRTGVYRVCAQSKPGDHLLGGQESWRVPGGNYVVATLSGRSPKVFENIPAFFADLVLLANEQGQLRDRQRPLIEVYRGGGVVDLLLPVNRVSVSHTLLLGSVHHVPDSLH